MSRLPLRYQNVEKARERHGAHAEKYASFLLKGDALADAAVAELSAYAAPEKNRIVTTAIEKGIHAVPDAPASLKKLFEQVDDVPLWVNWEQLDLGGQTFLRTGIFGAYVLVCYSLPLAYSSPAGNKPLIFSGKLTKMAPRRLHETGRFVLSTCLPGGLRRFSEGFRYTVKVRLIHAEVRRALLQSGKWREQEWGVPINQADMIGTNLLFSAIALEGLRRIGFRFSKDERDALVQLWRYSGHLMGIDHELLCATDQEARRLWELIMMTQGDADQDSRALTKALMEVPSTTEADRKMGLVLTEFNRGLSRALLGDEMANALGLPRTHLKHLRYALDPVVRQIEVARRLLPGGNSAAALVGTAVWRRMIEKGLAGMPAEFAIP